MFTEPPHEIGNRSVVRNLTSGLALAGLAVASALALAGPVSAHERGPNSPVPSDAKAPDRASEIFAPCIAMAAKTEADTWTCTAQGLTTATRDRNGRVDQVFTPVAPAIVSDDSEPSPLLDDYDGWCEDRAVCRRILSDFIEETKGNLVYGVISDSGVEVIGTFDVIIRTNLNGRQAQWRQTYIWDGGPGVFLDEVFANCWEVIDLWPDLSCGNHSGGGGRITSSSWRWETGTIFGNRLVNSALYYGAAEGRFNSDFNPTLEFVIPPLETNRFDCPGTEICRFLS